MIPQIRPANLAAWLKAQTSPAVVLDVREPEELQISGVRADGFTLVTIPMNDVPARLAELSADQPTAVLCHRGARSQRVAQFLVQNGFSNVANIAGGIDAWSLEVDASVPQY